MTLTSRFTTHCIRTSRPFAIVAHRDRALPIPPKWY